MTSLQRIHRAIGQTLLMLTFALPSYGQSMGASGGHDLDQLLSRAQKHYDLAREDAVVLLESERVTVLANGDLRTRIHRVVWIGGRVGIGDHADLRIPYNTDTSTLKVTVLRTWRDEVWWPKSSEVSPTAIVETLPFALARADDYTSMRETMLLHDGVELPCVVETVYEIEEQAADRDGADGLWVFAQRDPAVLIELVLDIPENISLKFHSGNGAPQPTVARREDKTTAYTWKMEYVDRLGSPLIADPASYAPYVSWSTWKDWLTLGSAVTASVDEAAVLSDALGSALADTLSRRLKRIPTPASKARSVAKYVDESTRSIGYDPRFWSLAPRAAARTWETAYGHGLDRAVLAIALFRQAGLEAQPVYRTAGLSGIDADVPGLSRFGGIAVWVTGDQFQAYYDPVSGTLTDGPRPFRRRVVWKPGTEPLQPDHNAADSVSGFDLTLTLEPGEDDGWKGTGFMGADGQLCPYDQMVGLHGDALARISQIAGSVFHGANAERFNPEVFEPKRVAVGFEISAKKQEPNDRGQTHIEVGDPSGGIVDQLPSDVHLYHEHRSSPILLTGMMTQRISLRLKTGQREIVCVPEARELENEVGRFSLRVEKEDGWVTIHRELTIRTATISPTAWPSLRALLLDETDSANRTVLLK